MVNNNKIPKFGCNYLTISLGVVSIKLRANASTFKEVQFWNAYRWNKEITTRTDTKIGMFG
jgi:hypothetical protein